MTSAAEFHIAGEGAARHLRLPVLEAVPDLAHAFTLAGSEAAAVTAAVVSRPLPLWRLAQVHGAGVVAVDGSSPAVPPEPPPTGDALLTARRATALAVQVADCVPILLADPVSGLIGAVHAGWRGTVAGVLPATLARFRELGGRMGDVRLALGPAIGACCFEVGAEVIEAFSRSVPEPGACIIPGPRPRIDLVEANRRQALALGVARDHVGSAGLCTFCRADLLESYRRSRGSPGRMAGIVAWRS
jgi:purine-nucleoside/S-methyl-5'-thioadenosine phosphorylase / adenosine deaminase